jgi:hypothetical protein
MAAIIVKMNGTGRWPMLPGQNHVSQMERVNCFFFFWGGGGWKEKRGMKREDARHKKLGISEEISSL